MYKWITRAALNQWQVQGVTATTPNKRQTINHTWLVHQRVYTRVLRHALLV